MSCLMGKSQLGSRDREAADLRDQRRTEGYGAHDSLKPVELTCGYLRLRAGFRFELKLKFMLKLLCIPPVGYELGVLEKPSVRSIHA